jgi:hypothetical protein
MVITVPYRRRARSEWRTRVATRVAVLFAGLMLLVRSQSVHAQVANEYEVKAAFLYNFAKFVEWPARAFPQLGESFVLCVLGDDPFGGTLERAVSGKSVQEREFAVRHVAVAEDAASCHMLFLSTAEPSHLRRLQAALHGAPVLIVGDEEDVVYGGGMIAFRKEGNRVRFMINQESIERAGLQVSSQLLKVADKVISTGAIP